jgi:hypothetical protein
MNITTGEKKILNLEENTIALIGQTVLLLSLVN